MINTFVYVHVGNKKNKYYNMLLISLESLRVHMPNQCVIILSDQKSADFLKENNVDTLYNCRIIGVDGVNKISDVEFSRYLKTNLRKLIKGDFLYLDSDTVVCEDFSECNIDSSVALVLDNHCVLSELCDGGKAIRIRAMERGIELHNCSKYFNSGVIYAKDDQVAHDFFDKWYNWWNKTKKENMYEDQFSLNYVNQICNVICELPGEFNCQITASPCGINYLSNAKIIHYFNTKKEGQYLLNDEKLILKGPQNNIIKKIISSPKTAFCNCILLNKNSVDVSLLYSKQYILMKKIYIRMNKIFRLNERILSAVLNWKRKR